MPSEVTLRQIAREAGVSLATVSFALRDSPKIAKPKREAIKKLAEEMGYRPNPLITAGMTRMRAARPTSFQATLGWINDHPESTFWNGHPMRVEAQCRAEQLGFALDNLFLPSISIEHPAENVRRFCKVARARGIHGVILPELMRAHHAMEEWPDLAVVVIGEVSGLLSYSTITPHRANPCFHSVTHDSFGNVRLAYNELNARGYRRIGLVGTEWQNLQRDNLPRAAALEMNALRKPAVRVPPLLTPHLLASDEKLFGAWMKKHRPDVVLSLNNDVHRWLRNLGLTPPADIGLAHIALGPLEEGWSGVNPREGMIGAAAVDLLSSHVLRNERGTPIYPKRVTVPGVWVDGKTTKSR